MRGMLRSPKLQTVILGSLALALLGVFFKGTDFRAIGESLVQAKPAFLGLAVALTMVTYLVRAVRWRYLLAPVGKPALGACFVTTVIGFTVNFLVPPGRLGEVARPYLLARREGFSASSTFATVFLERLLDLITVVLLVGGWLVLGSAPGGARSREAVYGLKVGGVAASLGAGLGLVLMFGFVLYRGRALGYLQVAARWLPRKLGRLAMRFLAAFGEGLGVLVDWSNLTRAGILSVILWLNISLAFWFGAQAFGIEISFGATFLVIGFLTVGVALPTPGAVGGYHVMCALALTLLFGVEENQAKAAALVNHAIAFLPVSLLGMVLFAREGLTFREVRSLGRSG